MVVSCLRGDFFFFKAFNDVSFFYIIKVWDAYTTCCALFSFWNDLFLSFKLFYAPLMDLFLVSLDLNLAVLFDSAFLNYTSCDSPYTGDIECLNYFSCTDTYFF